MGIKETVWLKGGGAREIPSKDQILTVLLHARLPRQIIWQFILIFCDKHKF